MPEPARELEAAGSSSQAIQVLALCKHGKRMKAEE